MSSKVKKGKMVALKSIESSKVIHKWFSTSYMRNYGKNIELKLFDNFINKRATFKGKI